MPEDTLLCSYIYTTLQRAIRAKRAEGQSRIITLGKNDKSISKSARTCNQSIACLFVAKQTVGLRSFFSPPPPSSLPAKSSLLRCRSTSAPYPRPPRCNGSASLHTLSSSVSMYQRFRAPHRRVYDWFAHQPSSLQAPSFKLQVPPPISLQVAAARTLKRTAFDQRTGVGTPEPLTTTTFAFLQPSGASAHRVGRWEPNWYGSHSVSPIPSISSSTNFFPWDSLTRSDLKTADHRDYRLSSSLPHSGAGSRLSETSHVRTSIYSSLCSRLLPYVKYFESISCSPHSH